MKLGLKKSEKTTIKGSKKLLPDTSQFFQVIRSGPTQVQAKNLSDNTIRTLKKEQITMVTFKENQTALRLIRDNFPKSLLWEFNQPHMKQSKQVYMQNIEAKTSKKKSVRFSQHSTIFCLQHLIDMEDEYLKKHECFSTFPDFLKKYKIFKYSNIRTKLNDGQQSIINIFLTLSSCPATSSRELAILYNQND